MAWLCIYCLFGLALLGTVGLIVLHGWWLIGGAVMIWIGIIRAMVALFK